MCRFKGSAQIAFRFIAIPNLGKQLTLESVQFGYEPDVAAVAVRLTDEPQSIVRLACDQMRYSGAYEPIGNVKS